MAIVPAEKLSPETNGEHLDPHPIPSGEQEMAQLVDEDEGRKNYDEGQHIVEQPSEQMHEPTLPASGDIPPTIGWRPGAIESIPPTGTKFP